MTMFFPSPCFNGVCYKGAALFTENLLIPSLSGKALRTLVDITPLAE